MCGINGAFSYSGGKQVDPSEVQRVRDLMANRGPDHAGYWSSSDGRIAFGHRRLSIIDLSEHGNQPMSTPDGRFHIVFNGEIYNHLELKAELEGSGIRFQTSSDTEVLLRLFEAQGTESFKRLRGMFAIAIWDEKAKSLVLARGQMGIKPLYYADNGSVFRFASQVKALLASRDIDTAPEPAGHAGFFVWGHVPEPYTLYRGIRQLPAGSYVRINSSGSESPVRFHNHKDWLLCEPSVGSFDELHDALADTVNHHFISDVPVSLFLSAGRDSATLLALATEKSQNPVHTVTLGFKEFEGTENDERPIAAELAKKYGACHTSHQVSSLQFKDEVGELLDAMDQPTVDGANTYFVCKVAASLGIKVALSGLGADEIFGGYPSFGQVPKLARSLQWTNHFPAAMRMSRKAASLLPTKKSPKYAGLLEYGGTIEGAFLLRRGLYMPWELFSFLDHDLAKKGLEDLAVLDQLRNMTSELPTDHSKIVMLESYWYMQNRLLRDSDWASMAHSLELRVPFVDVELMRRLAPWIASQKPPTKADMAQSPKNKLPESVLNRPKTGFNFPVAEWALNLDPDVPKEHSHRQWAKHVYRYHTGGDFLSK